MIDGDATLGQQFFNVSRQGATNSVRGAAKLLADAVATTRRAGATGLVSVRADSAYYCHDIIAAARSVGAWFSITARHTRP